MSATTSVLPQRLEARVVEGGGAWIVRQAFKGRAAGSGELPLKLVEGQLGLAHHGIDPCHNKNRLQTDDHIAIFASLSPSPSSSRAAISLIQ